MSHRSVSFADRPFPSTAPLLPTTATAGFAVDSTSEGEVVAPVNHAPPGDSLLYALQGLIDRLTVTQSVPAVPRRMAYSLEETAFLLGFDDVDTVRSLIARRLLKPSRGARHLRISHAEIERYLVATAA